MQSVEPKLSFYQAWHRLQRDNPALFVEVPDNEEPASQSQA